MEEFHKECIVQKIQEAIEVKGLKWDLVKPEHKAPSTFIPQKLDPQNRPVTLPSAVKSISMNEGRRDRPGMVFISPHKG